MATAVCKTQKSPIELINSTGLPHTCANQSTIDNVLSIIFITLGGFALLMVVIGGVRYITAGGNPESIAKARNMIVYSLIGLVIAAMAGAIVNVIAGRL